MLPAFAVHRSRHGMMLYPSSSCVWDWSLPTHTHIAIYQPVGFAWLVRCLQGLGLASFVGQQGWVPRRLQMFTWTQTERLLFYLGLELASRAGLVLYLTLCSVSSWVGTASQASSVGFLRFVVGILCLDLGSENWILCGIRNKAWNWPSCYIL